MKWKLGFYPSAGCELSALQASDGMGGVGSMQELLGSGKSPGLTFGPKNTLLFELHETAQVSEMP